MNEQSDKTEKPKPMLQDIFRENPLASEMAELGMMADLFIGGDGGEENLGEAEEGAIE
jgi:hypothetical protein